MIIMFVTNVTCLVLRLTFIHGKGLIMMKSEMKPETRQKLKALLLHHESFREYPYLDSTGHLTIGIGRNLSNRGISYTEAIALLDDDISYFDSNLSRLLYFFSSLDETRQIALIDMCFNLGIHGFLAFKNMLHYLEEKDFDNAAEEILNSKAAKQNPDRYKQLADMMRTGKF